MKKRLLSLSVLLGITLLICAQSSNEPERRLIRPSRPFFVPHWYVKAQGGAAYDVGEAKFTQLVSPSLQLALGYKFNELVGVRGTLSGLWAKNRYSYPEGQYSWNFIQPAIEAELDVLNLILGSDPERPTSVYAFAGAGVAFSFKYGMDIMQQTGMDSKVIRAGHANMFLSPIFRTTLATVANAVIELYDTNGAMGAAIGAALGCGYYATPEEAFRTLRKLAVVEPDVANKSAYLEAYERWRMCDETMTR